MDFTAFFRNLAPEWSTLPTTLQKIGFVREQLSNGETELKLIKSLRKDFDEFQARFLLAQADLQIRATKKFSRADQMLFTPIGLAQSSSETIAQYKRSLLNSYPQIYDVCCGIGGDAIALASATDFTGIDADEFTSRFCQHNLHIYDHTATNVLAQTFENTDIPPEAFVHIDPDRRDSSSGKRRRTIQADHFSPSLNAILSRAANQKGWCIKLAPATELEMQFDLPAQRHWIGHQRECKQQLLWLGPSLESQPSRRATVIDTSGNPHEFLSSDSVERRIVAPEISSYLYEPHSAVLAADLVDELASKFEMEGRLAYGSVYLTGNTAQQSALFATFQILAQTSMRKKAIEEALRAHDIGQVEWKSRGVDAGLLKKLNKIKLTGSEKGVVVATRTGDDYLAIIGKRMEN